MSDALPRYSSSCPPCEGEEEGPALGYGLGEHNQRTFEFQVCKYLDHLIAGCVTTAAKFPLHFSQPNLATPRSFALAEGGPHSDGQFHSSPHLECGPGGCRGDDLAEMPSVKPRAQLAFKDSMIRGILQFTLRIAFRCVLHRCKSQDIRC